MANKPTLQRPPRFRPLWPETAAPATALHKFIPNHRYDCVVIGAGITGCSAALHLAEAGAKVCVIDSVSPGAGTSGHANGQVMAELTLSPDRIVQVYGDDFGEAVIRCAARAPDLVFDLIARHDIACDARRTGWVEGTPFTWGMRSMERRVASWQRRGEPVELLDSVAIRKLSGTWSYAGGGLDRRGGTVNPLSYNRGLAAAAKRVGTVFHGDVEARQLLRERDVWRIATSGGPLAAGSVIVATNAYTGRLLPHFPFPVLCVYGVQSATVPLKRIGHILPQRQGFSDVRKRFFRLDEQDRLIVGGPGLPWAPTSDRSLPFRLIERALRKLFPEIRDVPFSHHWYARGAAAADLLPHLYEPEAGLFAALGFAGRGIAMGTLLGRVLARRVQGEPPRNIGFPITPTQLPLGLSAFRLRRR
jgi:glycine/D-amino acid oxidase-like deaminating enzyme